MKIYKFKVKDYSTVLIGQYVPPPESESKFETNQGYFYIQRGDGTYYKYEDYRIEWSKLIGEFE